MSTDKDARVSEDKDSTPTTTAVEIGTGNGGVASESGNVSTDFQSRKLSVEVADQAESGALDFASTTQEGDSQPTPAVEQSLEANQIQDTPQSVAPETPANVEVVPAPSDPTPPMETAKGDANDPAAPLENPPQPPVVPTESENTPSVTLNGDANAPVGAADVTDNALDSPAKEEMQPEPETKESETIEPANGTNEVSKESTLAAMETTEVTPEADQPSESLEAPMASDPVTSEELEKASEKPTEDVEAPTNVPSTDNPATEEAMKGSSDAPKPPSEDPPVSMPVSNDVSSEKPDTPMDPPTASDETLEPAVAAVETSIPDNDTVETKSDGSNKRALEEPPSSSANATNLPSGELEPESVEPPAKQPKLQPEDPVGTTAVSMDVETTDPVTNNMDAPVTTEVESPPSQAPPPTNTETNVQPSEGMEVDESSGAAAPVETTQPEATEDTPATSSGDARAPAEAVDQVDTVEPKTQPLEVKGDSQSGVIAETAAETTASVSTMDVDATTGGPVEPATAQTENGVGSSEAPPLDNGDAVAGEVKPPLQNDPETLLSENPSGMVDTRGDKSEEKIASNGMEASLPDKTKESVQGNGDASGDKSSKKGRKNNMDPRVLELRRNIQLGCRDNDLASAIQSYNQAVQDGVTVEAQSFYNLLNLCGGIERKVHVGKRKEDGTESAETKFLPLDAVDPKTRQEHAFRIKEHMTQLNIPLNEAAYTAIVKVLVANKDFEKAEEILRESEAVQQCRPKLRLYAPLLTAYCSERHMLSALRCWLAISKQEVQISERESMFLLRCAVATGDPVVFERVFSNLAEDVTVPSKDTVAAVLEWFASAHAMHTGINHPKRARDEEVRKLVDEIHEKETDLAPSMGPIVNKFGWNLDSSVTIDENGVLQEGGLKGVKLNPVQLPESAWETMMDMNRRIVLEGKLEGHMSEFQGGRKGKIRNDFDPEERKRQWGHFENFLEHVGPLDVVIDAANVGYMNQSFSNAPKHVNYEQIDWVARRFQKMRKRVLLVLHQRHFAKNLMPPKYRYLQDAWERMDILYKTPAGMNDDWFWLHAALKYRTLVLTNDEMRDHHFQMLSPRTFLRWKERHQVHFDFGDWETQGNEYDNGSRTRKVELQFPTPYSRRIQRVQDSFVIPLIKKGDENRFLDGYHVADHDEPEEETYLCICPLKEGETAAPEPMAALNNSVAPL
eukprot:Nitzschia sp. Nitz4//scaffold27_size158506//121016//124588//NITZ4_002618-RA/size158506-processed-gene-0.88-mRNA-1//-1//CDS//3329545542//4265//frame0